MPERLGQQYGNYRLIRLLGQGGFSDVYLAEHIHLETQVAVKVLSTRLTSENVEHFRTEARTVARLNHPHIVRILDFGVEDSTPYLAMDYAPNGSLRQHHPKGTLLPLDIIIGYIQQVAAALEFAHEKKLIHRDIKPENMLLGENYKVLLSDFGIALITQSTRYQNTLEIAGTAAYMAPERLQGKPRRASDQYALGIVVYEWICGDRPFDGSFTEIYSQQLFVPPPPLCEKVPQLPTAVEEVVMTALAKDPKQRFGNVKAFATALEQASQARSSHSVTQSNKDSVPSKPTRSTEETVANSPGQSSSTIETVIPPSQSSLNTHHSHLSSAIPPNQALLLSTIVSPSSQSISPLLSQPASTTSRKGHTREQVFILVIVLIAILVVVPIFLTKPLYLRVVPSPTPVTATTSSQQSTLTAVFVK